METLQHLANDSFSYGWLINLKPAALDGLDDAADEAASFIEVDPTWPSSAFGKRPSCEAQDFDFGLGLQPGPQQPLALLHADQLFSNGLLLPLHVLDPSPPSPHLKAADKADSSAAADLDALLSVPLYDGTTQKGSSSRVKDEEHPVLERWRRCSKKVLKKSLGFLKPLCRCGSRGRGRRQAPGKVGPETMSCPESESTTPRTSSAYSTAGDLLHGAGLLDFNVESSIYEAVLHCKKTNESELH